MKKRLFSILTALLLVAVAAPAAWAALADLGVPVTPHGYPAFYQDANGLQLEFCLDGDGIAGPCIFDPVIAGNPQSEASGFGAEAFYWMADANARPLVAGGRALLVLALEAAYGGAGEPADGEQMVFGRVRVRFDAPSAGFYRIIHPYGTIDLDEAFTAESLATHKDIRITTDIGAINPLDPAAAFAGALQAWDRTNLAEVPFLTWPNFTDPVANPALQVPILDGLGNQIGVNQYVGDGVTPHVVTGSPTGNNLFRIQLKDPVTGTFRTVTETNLFVVMGKVLDPAKTFTAYTFPPPPALNMFAVGPVNRATAFPGASSNLPHPGGVAAVPEFPLDPAAPIDYPAGTGFPIGFPYFYQERVTVPDPDPLNPGGTIEQGGLKLTLCPAFDPMCISAPVDPTNPASAALNVGDESFYWTAVSDISARTDQNRADVRVVMALEAAFANATGTPADGDQAIFARIRIRADVREPGDYTVTHPYGEITFTDVNTVDGINYTEDIGILNPGSNTVDQDFMGALFGKINPFLTCTTFVSNPTQLQINGVQYVGNPLVRCEVTGGPNGNIFRIQGPGGIDTTETLFTVTGKVYDPATFVIQPPAGVPTAMNDIATTDAGLSVVIDVVDNDVVPDAAPPITAVAVVPALGPVEGGTAVVNGTTITYTPAAGFVGIDTFAYTATNAAGTSNIATVEVTVLPVENLTTTRAELDLRKLEWNIQGASALNGTTITIHAGPTATGPVIGTTLVNGGKWTYRGRATSNPGVSSISLVSSTGRTLLNQPLRVR
jgi:hypothetical protein